MCHTKNIKVILTTKSCQTPYKTTIVLKVTPLRKKLIYVISFLTLK